MHRVVQMTSAHPALDIRIFHKECKSLVRNGYDVVLIAPHTADELVDGVQIRAIPKAKRRLERMTVTTWNVYRAALKENAQIYHFHDPELIPIALLLRMRGKKVIYDVHEDLPKDIEDKTWISKPLRGLIAGAMKVIEGVAAHLLSGIVAATPFIAKRFPAHKTVTVQNYPLLEELSFADTQSSIYAQRDPIAVYMGGITEIRGVREMITAVEETNNPQMRLVLLGGFWPEQLQTEVSQMPGYKKTMYMGWKNRTELLQLAGKARMGLVVLHPVRNYLESQPIKMYEYMALGLPIIASDFPFWREILKGLDCCLFVDSLDPKAIAKAMNHLLENPQESEAMGLRGKQAVLERFNWTVEAIKLLSFYKTLC